MHGFKSFYSVWKKKKKSERRTCMSRNSVKCQAQIAPCSWYASRRVTRLLVFEWPVSFLKHHTAANVPQKLECSPCLRFSTAKCHFSTAKCHFSSPPFLGIISLLHGKSGRRFVGSTVLLSFGLSIGNDAISRDDVVVR